MGIGDRKGERERERERQRPLYTSRKTSFLEVKNHALAGARQVDRCTLVLRQLKHWELECSAPRPQGRE